MQWRRASLEIVNYCGTGKKSPETGILSGLFDIVLQIINLYEILPPVTYANLQIILLSIHCIDTFVLLFSFIWTNHTGQPATEAYFRSQRFGKSKSIA